MMDRKSHWDYAKGSSEPLEVECLIHCGQIRDLDANRGINQITRIYRTEPPIEGGYLYITRDQNKGCWAVKSTLGNDIEGSALVCVGEILEAVNVTDTWSRMEVELATYFSCPIYEFHATSKGQRRLKARPMDDD